VKKGKTVKKEIKQEIKSELPYTPTAVSKRARAASAETPIQKRPGIITRKQQKALEALTPWRMKASWNHWSRYLGAPGKHDAGSGEEIASY